MNRLIARIFNITRLSWMLTFVAIIMVMGIMYWAVTMFEMNMVQLMFVVVFPLIFIVVIPLIAFFLFLQSNKKSYQK